MKILQPEFHGALWSFQALEFVQLQWSARALHGNAGADSCLDVGNTGAGWVTSDKVLNFSLTVPLNGCEMMACSLKERSGGSDKNVTTTFSGSCLWCSSAVRCGAS